MDFQHPENLQDLLVAEAQRKHLAGKASAQRKLEAALMRLRSFAPDPLPLDAITKEWVDRFSSWLTTSQSLTDNTRATYLRVIHAACRRAAREGASVDLSAFSVELRANAVALPKKEKASIDPRRHLWFAMKCRTCSAEEMEADIRKDFPSVEIFRTDVEELVKTRSGRKRQVVELLKNVLFFCTTMRVCRKIKFAYHDRAYIYDYLSNGLREMAIVSSSDLRLFMYLNSIAPERILYYFPDEADCPKIAEGEKVRIVEGPCKGQEATVSSQSRANPLEAEVLIWFPGLNVFATSPVPWRFLSSMSPR